VTGGPTRAPGLSTHDQRAWCLLRHVHPELRPYAFNFFPRGAVRRVNEPVPKGEFGGDLLQQARGPNDQPCCTILWETNRSKKLDIRVARQAS